MLRHHYGNYGIRRHAAESKFIGLLYFLSFIDFMSHKHNIQILDTLYFVIMNIVHKSTTEK